MRNITYHRCNCAPESSSDVFFFSLSVVVVCTKACVLRSVDGIPVLELQ